jgi:hypothetical protein
MLNEENTVIEGDESIQTPPPAPAQPDVADLARRAEAAERRAEAAERDRELWFNRATQRQEPVAPAPAPVIEEEDETPDYLNMIANQDNAAVQKTIRKDIEKMARKIAADTIKQGGYVSQDEARGIATATAQEYQAAAQLMQDYPEMQQENSPLRLEASNVLLEIQANSAYSQLPQIEQVRIATERAHNNLVRSGKVNPVPQPPPQDPRMQRIGAQQGGYGSGYGAPPVEQVDELTPQQKAAAAKYGVSEKAYRANISIGKYAGGRR